MSIGARIRLLRAQLGFTLDDVAKRSGVKRGTISALENRSSSRSTHLSAIAAALGVTVEHLLNDGDSTSSEKPSPLAAIAAPVSIDISDKARPINALLKLKRLIEQSGYSDVTSFGRAYGINPAQISHWVTGFRPFGERARKLTTRKLRVPENYFEDGESSGTLDAPAQIHHLRPDVFFISQYDTAAAAGGTGLVLAEQPQTLHGWEVSAAFFASLPPYTRRENLKILTGFGDSTRGLIEPGDPVLVDTGICQCDQDGLYLLRLGREVFIKRLQRVPSATGITLKAISPNREYDPYTLGPEIDFEVLAKVLASWSYKKY